ncbi:hypothetical protein HY36_00695 [Hyphomonas atlantica]|uniref:Uncharacterized protein n=1 Tax=Hyphomonas atlantica TaxID=1280948 RepID=A0A059EBG8_9PROT|nr:hypothetical protein HY36_00695 [Hyphomonas atlantica]
MVWQFTFIGAAGKRSRPDVSVEKQKKGPAPAGPSSLIKCQIN